MTTNDQPVDPPVRPRPPILRALGRKEPPAEIDIDGKTYRLERVVKHDSWAATAFYAGDGQQIVCKFNRQKSIGLMPMRWLGWWLGRREAFALRLLSGLAGIPRGMGEVRVAGRPLSYAVAHEFISGRPLRRHDHVSKEVFADFEKLMAEVHRRGMAYVDLHKRENILLGEDGRLYLLDFQVCFFMHNWWPANSLPARIILKLLQGSDRYHLGKHYTHCVLGKHSAGPLGERPGEHVPQRPLLIRVHRFIAQPLRALRRWLLVKLGVRSGRGRVETEYFPEEVVRVNREADRAA